MRCINRLLAVGAGVLLTVGVAGAANASTGPRLGGPPTSPRAVKILAGGSARCVAIPGPGLDKAAVARLVASSAPVRIGGPRKPPMPPALAKRLGGRKALLCVQGKPGQLRLNEARLVRLLVARLHIAPAQVRHVLPGLADPRSAD
jgi:hypothetical protein